MLRVQIVMAAIPVSAMKNLLEMEEPAQVSKTLRVVLDRDAENSANKYVISYFKLSLIDDYLSLSVFFFTVVYNWKQVRLIGKVKVLNLNKVFRSGKKYDKMADE